MKKFNIILARGRCAKCNNGESTLTISGSLYADGRIEAARIIEHPFCSRKEISNPTEENLVKVRENLGIIQVPPQRTIDDLLLPSDILAQIEREKEESIKRGWDASKSDWRATALRILCETALSEKIFTVNDFRDRIKQSGVTTHDNRAMGGLMMTARQWGWIEESGEEIESKVGHKSHIQVWRSKIY